MTPIAWVAERADRELILDLARAMDAAADAVGVDFIGGFSALVQKGASRIDEELMAALPAALAETAARLRLGERGHHPRRASTWTPCALMGETSSRRPPHATADRDGFGCAKLVVFANMPEDNPFMAGAFHGVGEPEAAINVGVSGPGRGRARAASACRRTRDLHAVAEEIKRTAFKVTRVGELIGREVAAPPGRGLRHRRPLAGPHAAGRRQRRRDPRGHGHGARAARPARPPPWPCSTTR